MSNSTPTTTHERRGLIAGLVLGVPFIAVGVADFVANFDGPSFRSFLRFFIGGALADDLVVAPVAALIGVAVIRRVPALARAPLRAALFGSAVAVAVAWPELRSYGRMRTPDNKSVQPLNYTTAVATVVGVVWIVSALWLAVIIVRDHRNGDDRARPESSRGHGLS